MLFFRSEERVREWCAARGVPMRSLVRMDQLWTLATTWYANIKSVHGETDKPLRVGSRVAFEARFIGRSLDYSYEIRELEPGVRLVMSTGEVPFPMETTYTWHDMPRVAPA